MKKHRIKKLLLGEFSWKRVVRSILFIYFCLALYAMFAADSIIFQPQRSSYQDDKNILKLKTSDGVLISAVYLPNPKATYTILFSHGNAEDIGDNNLYFEELRNQGYSIFGYDYHGYGTSQGKPSEVNAYRDIDAAYSYLTETLKIAPEKIVLQGRSVGSGPAVDLASRKPVGGLILESPFLSAFRVLTRIPVLPGDKFVNINKIKKVTCPLLVLHGTRDQVIPFWHGKELYEAANEPKRFLWVDGGGHNNLMIVGGELYWKSLREFNDFLQTPNKSGATK